MVYCPKDFKPCIDDLCYGGRCILTGEEPYEKCQVCGAFFEIGLICEECDDALYYEYDDDDFDEFDGDDPR